jgi:hypothetical protein
MPIALPDMESVSNVPKNIVAYWWQLHILFVGAFLYGQIDFIKNNCPDTADWYWTLMTFFTMVLFSIGDTGLLQTTERMRNDSNAVVSGLYSKYALIDVFMPAIQAVILSIISLNVHKAPGTAANFFLLLTCVNIIYLAVKQHQFKSAMRIAYIDSSLYLSLAASKRSSLLWLRVNTIFIGVYFSVELIDTQHQSSAIIMQIASVTRTFADIIFTWSYYGLVLFGGLSMNVVEKTHHEPASTS